MNISANYFTVTFAMLEWNKLIKFSRGLVWIPILHVILLQFVYIVDKKNNRINLRYRYYSRMKIYECCKSDEELMR